MTEIKTIGGFRRREGSTREALYERWQEQHAPYVMEHAEPEHYRITLIEGRADGSESPYDGLAELWFRDEAHRQTWVGEGSTRWGDGFNDALEPGAGFALVTTEQVIVDGDVPTDAHKIVYLIRRRADVAQGDFLRHWREIHAPNVASGVERTEGCLRYAISPGSDPRCRLPRRGRGVVARSRGPSRRAPGCRARWFRRSDRDDGGSRWTRGRDHTVAALSPLPPAHRAPGGGCKLRGGVARRRVLGPASPRAEPRSRWSVGVESCSMNLRRASKYPSPPAMWVSLCPAPWIM